MVESVGERATVRFDELGGYYTLVLPVQSGKPRRGGGALGPAQAPAGGCQFCPGREHDMGALVAERGDPWSARAALNKWSVGSGHAVVVLSRRHVGLYDVTAPEWAAALEIMADLAAGPDAVVFANHGLDAGASQPHAHAQVMTIDGLGHPLGDLAATSGPGCVLCPDKLAGDVVFAVGGWVCWSPAAPRTSGELRLVADTHRDAWEPALGAVIVAALVRVRAVLGDVGVNLVFHLSPGAHAHVHVLPRTTPITVYQLGWNLSVSTDPAAYAAALVAAVS